MLDKSSLNFISLHKFFFRFNKLTSFDCEFEELRKKIEKIKKILFF